MKLIITIVLSLVFTLRLDAAMVRVVAVHDSRTLVIERNGARETIRLAGVATLDELRATELLRWTVGSSWILAEVRDDGDFFVWRSPDALFVNRELVQRGFARATQFGIEAESNLNVTYLGEVSPAAPRSVSATAPKTGSDRSLRSSAPPSRRTRSGRALSAPRGSAPPRSRKK